MATYKEIVGQKITKVTSDPSEPKTGQMWYNSTTGTLRGLGVVEAWISGSPILSPAGYLGSAGTQTAGLVFAMGNGSGTSFSAQTYEYNGSGWSSGGDMSTAKTLTAAGGTQTAAYAAAGQTGGSTYTNNTEEYGGTSWTAGGNYPGPMRAPAGTGPQTAAIAFGGSPGGSGDTNATNYYDGSAWTAQSGTLSIARNFLDGAGTQTAAITAGGWQNPGNTNSTEEWDGSSWTAGGNYPAAIRGLALSGTQTKTLGFGGVTTTYVATAFEYDGSTWSSKPSMATARRNSGRANVGGTASATFAAGGFDGSGDYSITEEFTSSTNTITAAAFSSGGAANFARRQLGYTGAGTQNAFMVYGGFSPSGMVNNSEEYGGATWTATPTLNTARGQNAGFGITTAAVACGGATPTIGGYTEEYNGSSWTTGNSMSTSRYEFGATGILTAGLALQGDQGPSTPFGVTCEEYDGTNWSSGGSANTARRTNSGVGTQTATITAGGQIPGPSATANVESYDGTSWSEVNNLNVARGGNAVMGGPAGATSSVITGGNVPTQFSISEQWNGTNMVTGASMANDRSTHGAGGTSALGIVGLGQVGPSPPYGDADTEEYVGETSAANVTNFTTS